MKKIIVIIFIFLQTSSFSQTSAEQIIEETIQVVRTKRFRASEIEMTRCTLISNNN